MKLAQTSSHKADRSRHDTARIPRSVARNSAVAYADPLGDDVEADEMFSITNRQFARLIFIAAETGARFEREQIALDAAEWLYRPHEIFDGKAAVDACHQKSAFLRAVLLHGLSLGLDACPKELDRMLNAKSASPQADPVVLAA